MVNTKQFFFSLSLFVLLFACSPNANNGSQLEKELVLAASREKPSSRLFVKLYADRSFVFTNAGILKARSYSGTYQLNSHTVLLSYTDFEPDVVGKQLLLKENELTFLDREGSVTIDSIQVEFLKRVK